MPNNVLKNISQYVTPDQYNFRDHDFVNRPIGLKKQKSIRQYQPNEKIIIMNSRTTRNKDLQ
jgi:hypothetical protein